MNEMVCQGDVTLSPLLSRVKPGGEQEILYIARCGEA